MKKSLSDYTEAEFLRFMQEIRTANKNAADDVLDPLLDHFLQHHGASRWN